MKDLLLQKKKHAKNLKRLKKYTAKQGNKYAPVPNFIKGTLTRKLYEGIATINNLSIPLEIMNTPSMHSQGMIGRNHLEGLMLFPYN